jgi:adhesin transport system outer membrane protein
MNVKSKDRDTNRARWSSSLSLSLSSMLAAMLVPTVVSAPAWSQPPKEPSKETAGRNAAATIKKQRLTLSEAEQKCRSQSLRLKASAEEQHSASEQAKAQRSALYPKLTLEGMGRYVSEVPTMKVGPTVQTMGDNKNYSIGPVLSYTLWDTGAQSKSTKSAEKFADAKESERITTEENILLSTRIAYAQAQLAEQDLKQVTESLELSRTQSRDIDSRFRAGSASRLDSLNAKTDVSNFELRRAQSLAEYSVATAELAAWVGQDYPPDQTLQFDLDDLEEAAKAIDLSKIGAGPSDHPQLKMQSQLAESSDLAAQAQASQYWPVVTAQAKTTLDYPNGSNLEQINQKTAQVNLTWSLFEWGKTDASVAQKRADAMTFRYRRDQAESDLKRDWAKARARLTSLIEQRETATTNVHQSEEIARLKYDTYKAGRATYLEVQSANLKLLESKVAKARIEAQMLAQYHTLRFLSGREEK